MIVLQVIIALSVLIAIHECGHFFFARIFAEQRINVEGLKAFRIEDDQSLQVFEVVIPEQVDTRSLHRIMGERAKRMGLRLSMQHAAIFEAIHRVRVV